MIPSRQDLGVSLQFAKTLKAMYIDEDTFVVQLTVGQLISLLKKEFPALTSTPISLVPTPEHLVGRAPLPNPKLCMIWDK